MLLSLLACTQSFVIAEDDSTVGLDGTEEDTSMWDGATLEVLSTASGDFLPWQEAADFEAVVYDAEGVATDFSDIAWGSDVDAAWVPVGTAFSDDSLEVGTHALTATALLPNGDRLAYTIGGVLVQSAYTGIYSGDITVNIAMEYDGTSYAAGCSGAVTIVVDAYGETATGDAGCLLSLLSYELDTAYGIELENSDGALAGASTADLVIFEYDFDTSGTVTEDGSLDGSFADDVYGYAAVDGSFSTTRLSRDISGI